MRSLRVTGELQIFIINNDNKQLDIRLMVHQHGENHYNQGRQTTFNC